MHPALLQADREIAFRRLGDECLLVPVRRSPSERLSVFTLNSVGVFLWHELQQPRSMEALVAAVVATFEVSQEAAARDVATFVNQLSALQLVKNAAC